MQASSRYSHKPNPPMFWVVNHLFIHPQSIFRTHFIKNPDHYKTTQGELILHFNIVRASQFQSNPTRNDKLTWALSSVFDNLIKKSSTYVKIR